MKNAGEISQLTIPFSFFDRFFLSTEEFRQERRRTRVSRVHESHAITAVINEPIDRRVKLMLFIFDWIEVGALASRVLP